MGILGGSFDPAHEGHIKISIEAKKQFKIDKSRDAEEYFLKLMTKYMSDELI